MSKKPWLSKTLWANWLMATVAFVPGVGEYATAHPEAAMLLVAAVNTVLRFKTDGRIGLE